MIDLEKKYTRSIFGSLTWRRPFQSLKYMWQRATRGWADCDTWGFDTYLSVIIADGVRNIANKHCGCPEEFFNHDAPADHECDEWAEILNTIADGFDAAYDLVNLHMTFERTEDGNSILKTMPHKKSAALTAKFDKGMKLFHKYYHNLWD